MKTKLFFIGIAALLFASCGTTVIESGDLTLKIDGNMHFKVESSAPGAQKYFDEYQAADALIADEAVIQDWKVKKVQIISQIFILNVPFVNFHLLI